MLFNILYLLFYNKEIIHPLTKDDWKIFFFLMNVWLWIHFYFWIEFPTPDLGINYVLLSLSGKEGAQWHKGSFVGMSVAFFPFPDNQK